MTIDTKTMVSISDANQNFSKVARLVDECGSAVILKNNVPRYLVIDFSKADKDFTASDEDVLSISKQLMEQNKEAYEVRLNEKTEQKADSYASYSIDSADWWKRWSQRLQFIGFCIRKSFSVFWRGGIVSYNSSESREIRVWVDKKSLHDRWK